MPTYDIANRLSDLWQERVTQSPKFIDTDHAYVHEGIAYDAFWTGVLAAASSQHFQFSTPAGKYVHFRPASVGINGGIATFRIFLAASGSATPVSGGSTFTPVNRKHTSTSASQVTFNTGIATSSTANYTLKYETKIYGGSGPGGSRTGQAKGEPLEWIFTPGRDYVFMVTTTAETDVGLNLTWYEEDNA